MTRNQVLKAKKSGEIVRVKDNVTGLFASMFIGQTGKVLDRCGVYQKHFVVDVGEWRVSLHPNELEEERKKC
jgi:hypothetical protein